MIEVARVSRSENDLLTVARALFEPRQHPVAVPIVRSAQSLGDTIGRTSARVLEDVLAKGLVRTLARELSLDSVPRAPERLHVSAGSFRLLRWMVQAPLSAPKVPALRDDGAQHTFADQLLVVLACDLAESAEVLSALYAQSWVRRAPLLALFRVDRVETPDITPDLLEAAAALPSAIARRWIALETYKAGRRAPGERTSIGRAQAALLEPLVKAALAGKRWESLRFLLDATSSWPARTPLDPETPLSARAEARRFEVAPLRSVRTIGAARARMRLVGYVDDDYDDAQKALRFLAPWDELFARADALVLAADDLEELR